VCVYVLVAIIRKELGLELSLSQILQVLSVNVFEQAPLAQAIRNQQKTLQCAIQKFSPPFIHAPIPSKNFSSFPGRRTSGSASLHFLAIKGFHSDKL
jgi:hypothetical protein